MTKKIIYILLSVILYHFSLLLLLTLELDRHQPVVELGDLPPHHLDLVIHGEAALRTAAERG